MRLQIQRSGEIVRDSGVLYFFKILKEMDINKKINPILEKNRITFEEFEDSVFSDYILKNVFYKVFINSITPDLRKEKVDNKLIEKIYNSKIEEFVIILNEMGLSEKKVSEIKEKSRGAKYFPYLRNSAKYGANSQSEENFHKNFRQLAKIFFSSLKGDKSILETYSPDKTCSICHMEKSAKYDITHKYKQEEMDSLKEKDKKIRVNSKYNYTFMGSESNTYNNYGREESSICFNCEFFNLMFLLYVNLEKPKVLASSKSMEEMDFINHKLMLKRSYYTEQGFTYHLSKYSMDNVKLYNLEIDANKGIILRLSNVMNFRKMLKRLEYKDIIDNYSFALNPSDKKRMLKKQIDYGNISNVREFLLGEIMSEDYLYFNIREYKKMLEKMKIEKLEEGYEMSNINENEAFAFKKLGRYLQGENKDTFAYRLIQLLKSDNREDLLVEISHAYLSAKKSEKGERPSLPYNFSKDILYSEKLDLHFYITNIMEGLLETKGGEK